MQKIYFVFLNRLLQFYRAGYQWAILFTPLLYIVLQLVTIWAILKVSVEDEDGEETDTSKLIVQFFTGYFVAFLVLGSGISAMLYAYLPLADKAGGLRQMMFICGLSSTEYFTGLLCADMIIFNVPNVVISCLLPIFP